MKTKLLLTLMICGFAMGLASVVLASGGNYNAVGKAQVTAKTEKVACANARDEAVKDAVRVCAKSHLLPQMDQFLGCSCETDAAGTMSCLAYVGLYCAAE